MGGAGPPTTGAEAVDIELEKHGYGEEDASFQAAGGQQGLVELVDRFYEVMDELPSAARIRAMHPKDLTVSRDKLVLFLCGWLGGPRLYQAKYGEIFIPRAHAHLEVGEEGRDSWLECMALALEKVDYEPAFKSYLLKELRVPAERIRMVAES